MQTISTFNYIKELPVSAFILNSQFEIEEYSRHLLVEFIPGKSDLYGVHIAEAIPFLPTLFFSTINDCMVYKTEDHNDAVQYVNDKDAIQWVKWRIKPVLENNQTVNLFIYLEEVSEHKQMQDFFTRVEEVALVGGWQLNIKTKELIWTESTKKIHEVPPSYKPSLKTGIKFYKEGPQRERIQQLVDNAVKYGVSYNEELIIITAKGNEKWVRAKGETDFVNGECIRLFGTFQDIDKEKRAELEMSKAASRLEIATTSGRIGIWEYDLRTDAVVWDRNMFTLFGINPKSFTNNFKHWVDSLHPEDRPRVLKEVDLAIRGVKEYNSEYRIIAKYNKIRTLKAQGTVLRDGKGEPYKMIGTNWDITEIRQNEARLQKLLKLTTNQKDSLLNFAHIVSHNLRSHSSNISMLSHFISQDNSTQEDLEEYLDMLQQSSSHLNETLLHLNEVIQISTDDSQKIKQIPIKKSLDIVLESLKDQLKNANTTLKNNINEKAKVAAIQPYLESVLLNLISNAVRYKRPDKDLELTIDFYKDKDESRISIKDNGLGINLPRHKKKIFGMYKTFHDHPEARGVGLFISKNQMQSMNGDISVDSKPNKGSTFILTFYNDLS
ncbi:sensor histidine kinase [Croceivirga sp. JEA036]|uniref:sensor histidine kinase n=1 Tax=Croceivirga sp. JEA036 TaxID=2721162 RepID=UPI00143AF15F|nr:HAMP domain-containing sensor histidine kinase [Croceivirga sp. JEA036]NJB36980.1 PAS domain-containing protein [Croceivirga sp. JEA036]